MIQAIDHIVILVSDLAAATADYGRLGFQVAPGGEHTDGATHNALVSLADGAYLELLAFRRTAPQHRWWRHVAAGGGLIDFALLPESTPADLAAARERGLAISGPMDGGRTRPDGVELRWQTGLAARRELPFLCGDLTPRELRVPGPAFWDHPNGARGLASVIVAVRDLEASAAAYAALLGQLPLVEPGSRTFRLGDGAVVLRTPTPHGADGPALEAHLAAHGEGIYAIELRGGPAGPRGPLSPALAHGARIALV